MAQKVTVTLDASKLRNLVTQRSYTDRDGKEVQLQEIKFDLIEMKPESQKTVFTAEKYSLVKTHFAVEQQTKEQRDAGMAVNYIGEGVSIIWNNDNHTAKPYNETPTTQDGGDDFPF